MDKEPEINYNGRKTLIESVKTSLAFFALAILIVEGLLCFLATKAQGLDFTIIVVAMALVIPLSVGGVVFLESKKLKIQPQIGLSNIENASLNIVEHRASINFCDLRTMDKPAIDNKLGRLNIKPILERLDAKLRKLHEKQKGQSDVPFIQVGSTYLDIILGPISTKQLCQEEWINLDPIIINIGGSAMHVGRYLYMDYNMKGYLFTLVSNTDDVLSKEFRRLLDIEKETWLLSEGLIYIDDVPAPVTTLLVQSDRNFATMFTYPGALDNFCWKDVQPRLSQILSGGGVLYISGFLKTKLSSQLRQNLIDLNNNNLICLDHGRLNPHIDNPRTVRALYEAFGEGLIDIYFCTFNELLNFWRIATGKNRSTSIDQMRETLEEIAKTENMPPVTFVRNTIGERNIAAYAIIGEAVDPITDRAGSWLQDTPVAPQNAFNASVLYHLINEAPKWTFREHIIDVGEKALHACHQHRNQDRSRV